MVGGRERREEREREGERASKGKRNGGERERVHGSKNVRKGEGRRRQMRQNGGKEVTGRKRVADVRSSQRTREKQSESQKRSEEAGERRSKTSRRCTASLSARETDLQHTEDEVHDHCCIEDVALPAQRQPKPCRRLYYRLLRRQQTPATAERAEATRAQIQPHSYPQQTRLCYRKPHSAGSPRRKASRAALTWRGWLR
eukprot:2874860-Pleurochrysis_carterae.AAC.1